MHFQDQVNDLRSGLLASPVIDRGSWQSQKIVDDMRRMHELRHITVRFNIPELPHDLISLVGPNLPWAEDHFQERVSGKPLNPPPSAEWWPYAQKNNTEFKSAEKFSHTYPERFWPRFANVGQTRPNGREVYVPHNGIRFEYGDLGDLVDQLVENPYTRQAYLPVWFPEDLTAAREGQRVPCTLGYHFLGTSDPEVPANRMDITYFIRSCDFVRHFKDDVYMAARLCQWVVSHLNDQALDQGDDPWVPGEMVMRVGSLHCFVGDRAVLQHQEREAAQAKYQRVLGALG